MKSCAERDHDCDGYDDNGPCGCVCHTLHWYETAWEAAEHALRSNGVVEYFDHGFVVVPGAQLAPA